MNNMKVFINKRTGMFSGGMIIVAANNVKEAQQLLDEYLFDGWYSVADKYEKGNWVELRNVTSTYETPTFVAEDGHS